jgi:GTP-binding protein HflX
VGFIHKLPPTIITAFRATLEELNEASLLVHVVDLAARNAAEQCQTVEDILADLRLKDKPQITALNKIDRLLPDDRTWDETAAISYFEERGNATGENTVVISAARGWGLTGLRESINEALVNAPNPAP